VSGGIPQASHNLYSRSPFRLLGVSAEQPPEVLEARLREVVEACREGVLRRPPGDLPWLPEVRQDEESVRQAGKVLSEVRGRLYQRLWWPHARTSVDREALGLARQGDFVKAAELWQQAWKDEPGARATAAHNLAILYHSRSLAAPRGLAAATRDFELARTWWRHVVEGGRLEALLLDGEGDRGGGSGLLEQVDRLVRRDLGEVIRHGRHAAGAAGPLPLFGPGFIGQEDVGVESYDARRARLEVALEEAEEAARQGRREEAEAAVERARELVVLPADARKVEETWRRLALRLVMRGLEKVHRQPLVVSYSGMGTALFGMDRVDPATHSYEARLMFIVGHLPVLPLGRFRVRYGQDGSPEFIGRLPADFATLLHIVLAVAALSFSLWGGAHLNRMRGYHFEHLIRDGGPAALTRLEARELQRSYTARQNRIVRLARASRSLREEQEGLRRLWLPQLERRRQAEQIRVSPGREERLRLLDLEIDRARERLEQIPGELQAVAELRREIEALDRPRR